MKITIARNGNSQDGFEHRLAFDFAGNEFVWRGNDSAALESIWDRATGEFTIRDVPPRIWPVRQFCS